MRFAGGLKKQWRIARDLGVGGVRIWMEDGKLVAAAMDRCSYPQGVSQAPWIGAWRSFEDFKSIAVETAMELIENDRG